MLLQFQGGREGRLKEKERLRDEKVVAQVLDAGQELFGPKTCSCCIILGQARLKPVPKGLDWGC